MRNKHGCANVSRTPCQEDRGIISSWNVYFLQARQSSRSRTCSRILPSPSLRADRPYTVLNFVTTLDGQVTLGDTGAREIGSETDHRLMRRLRTVADGLMHGAGTIRQDNFPPRVPPDLIVERLARGLAEQPLGVAISASGNLSPALRYFSVRPPAVFTMNRHQAALSEQLGSKATVFGVGEEAVDLAGGRAYPQDGARHSGSVERRRTTTGARIDRGRIGRRVVPHPRP